MDLFGIDVALGGEIEVGGLSVFPLLGSGRQGLPYLSGPEVFGTPLVEVRELRTAEASGLAVNNLSSFPVLLVEGEMLIGVNQNRTMNVTVMCPPQTTTVIPVSCVEAGRWSSKGRGSLEAKSRFAPGSLRSAKTSSLHPRGSDPVERVSDQETVWDAVRRQQVRHGVRSDTSALDDVQDVVEERMKDDLDQIEVLSDQIGVVCASGGRVLGLDLFDQPDTLATYIRSIVAGHALDATHAKGEVDTLGVVERFLALLQDSEVERGEGVGLGNEVLLRGSVAGVGLEYEGSLVHLAAFPAEPVPAR